MSHDSGQPETLITAFAVPAAEDERFLAAWERAREALGAGVSVLHRALRPDVDLRFVDVARADAPGWRDALAAAGATAAAATYAAAYERIREDGRPGGEGGVVRVEPFEVPPGGEGEFLAAWDRARAVEARQQGYVGTRLHRSAAGAAFRFVAMTRWSSPLMVARARQRAEVQDATAAMPFPSRPALYTVVRG